MPLPPGQRANLTLATLLLLSLTSTPHTCLPSSQEIVSCEFPGHEATFSIALEEPFIQDKLYKHQETIFPKSV